MTRRCFRITRMELDSCSKRCDRSWVFSLHSAPFLRYPRRVSDWMTHSSYSLFHAPSPRTNNTFPISQPALPVACPIQCAYSNVYINGCLFVNNYANKKAGDCTWVEGGYLSWTLSFSITRLVASTRRTVRSNYRYLSRDSTTAMYVRRCSAFLCVWSSYVKESYSSNSLCKYKCLCLQQLITSNKQGKCYARFIPPSLQ